jgi:REP element-mobilizing transposase RayT
MASMARSELAAGRKGTSAGLLSSGNTNREVCTRVHEIRRTVSSFDFVETTLPQGPGMLTLLPLMQLSLFDRPVQIELARTQHGGDFRRGERKLERPVSTRRPMHVVLTSRRARGPWSLRKHDRAVRDVLRRMARRFDVRVYDFANVGSHLHLVLRARRREGFQGFLRSFTGIVARRITGAERGRQRGRFFDGLAWSRVVSWGRDYWGLRHYVFRNQIEGDLGPGIREAFERGPDRAPHRQPRAAPRSPPSRYSSPR